MATEHSRIGAHPGEAGAPMRGGWRIVLRDLLVAALVVAGLWMTVPQPLVTARAWQLGLAAVCVAAVTLRRLSPVAATAVVAAATGAAWIAGLTADPCVLVGLCLFTVAERHGRRPFPWWLLAAVALTAPFLLGFNAGGIEAGLRWLVIALVVIAASWALGVRSRQVRAEAARRAGAEERLRLSRDVHDVLAHSLGTIGVRAGVSAHVASLGEAELRGVLREVETQARDSLGELRGLLSRERGDDPTQGPATSLPASLDGIARTLERAGVRTELTADDGLDGLPAAHRTTIERVVREAATNVVRHSGAGRCRIAVTADPSAVTAEVSDDGHGAGGTLRGGHGLTGMRERAALLGGTLHAGDGDHGFVVSLRLPLDGGEERP